MHPSLTPPSAGCVLCKTFSSGEDAARAYDRAAVASRGKAAVTNFHLSQYAAELQELAAASEDELPAVRRRIAFAATAGKCSRLLPAKGGAAKSGSRRGGLRRSSSERLPPRTNSRQPASGSETVLAAAATAAAEPRSLRTLDSDPEPFTGGLSIEDDAGFLWELMQDASGDSGELASMSSAPTTAPQRVASAPARTFVFSSEALLLGGGVLAGRPLQQPSAAMTYGAAAAPAPRVELLAGPPTPPQSATFFSSALPTSALPPTPLAMMADGIDDIDANIDGATGAAIGVPPTTARSVLEPRGQGGRPDAAAAAKRFGVFGTPVLGSVMTDVSPSALNAHERFVAAWAPHAC